MPSKPVALLGFSSSSCWYTKFAAIRFIWKVVPFDGKKSSLIRWQRVLIRITHFTMFLKKVQNPLAVVVASVVILLPTFISCVLADLVTVDLLKITRLTF